MTKNNPYILTRIQQACELLAVGEVVAIPTETVYGLAADAGNDKAVAKIYQYKERPSFNPLIVHVASATQASQYVRLTAKAPVLIEAFWPGALTLVLPLLPDSRISPLCTAGLRTLGVRSPSHPITRKILESSGLPLAAPSANPSSRLSPTTASHVRDAFQGIDLPIVDGGSCAIGIESTILDLSETTPALLRHGAILKEDLERVLGQPIQDHTKPIAEVKSPGQTLRHYAPLKPLRMNVMTPSQGEGYLAFGAYQGDHTPTLNLSVKGDLIEAAANLFQMLHQLETLNITGISVAPIPNIGLGLAINDKLSRAIAYYS